VEYICGEESIPAGSKLIMKSGYVVSENEEYYNNNIKTVDLWWGGEAPS
jgi:hypothetical protein